MSKIYTDKRIFDLNSDGTKLEKSLEDLRMTNFILLQMKNNKDEFENKVSNSNRLKTKGIEVGHIFIW